MRCPKCHYLSFDPEPRCKNCGYDLEVADADLALRTAEPAGDPIADLALHERPLIAAVPAPEPRLALVEVDPPVRPQVEPPRVPFRAPNTTAELPLFVKAMAGREELRMEDVTDEPVAVDRQVASVFERPVASAFERPVASATLPPARPPLVVRRAVVEPARARPRPAERRLGPLDNDLLEDLNRVEREEAERARAEALAIAEPALGQDDAVEPAQRIGAVAIDTAVLGAIAAFVFWATLRLCNLSLSQLGLAALAPMLLFLGMMDLGYLLMFTAAGGQTVGKMLMGIRVVGDSADDGAQLSLRQAAWRAVVSVVGLGLGWLPALVGRGTLHDRLAHTRVVRA